MGNAYLEYKMENVTDEEFYNAVSVVLRAAFNVDLVDLCSFDAWMAPFREISEANDKTGILIRRKKHTIIAKDGIYFELDATIDGLHRFVYYNTQNIAC